MDMIAFYMSRIELIISVLLYAKCHKKVSTTVLRVISIENVFDMFYLQAL